MNIIKVLEGQIEKGNLLVDGNGDCINQQKIEKAAKKAYLAAVKADEIDMVETPYTEYLNGYMAGCSSIQSIIDMIKEETTNYEEEEAEPEEEEPDAEEEEPDAEEEEPDVEEEPENKPFWRR